MKTAVVLTLAGGLVGSCILFVAMKQLTEYTYRSLMPLEDTP